MSDRIEAEILDALGEEVDAAVDTPLIVIEGTKGDPGKDGITPTIGANGNWYLGAADTGKPSRGETGAQGTPGIYYGTTPPAGDTHPVWIDPNGDHDDGGLLPAVTAADNGKVLRVVSGAWSPVDMPSGGGGETWEAINVITLTDAVNTVTINTDSGGNAIALKKVRILAEGSATANQDLFFNNARYIRGQVVGTAVSVGALAAEPFCGKMYCFAVLSTAANYAAANQLANIFSAEIIVAEIKLIVNNAGTFSAGTKFTIQGVRA